MLHKNPSVLLRRFLILLILLLLLLLVLLLPKQFLLSSFKYCSHVPDYWHDFELSNLWYLNMTIHELELPHIALLDSEADIVYLVIHSHFDVLKLVCIQKPKYDLYQRIHRLCHLQ